MHMSLNECMYMFVSCSCLIVSEPTYLLILNMNALKHDHDEDDEMMKYILQVLLQGDEEKT